MAINETKIVIKAVDNASPVFVDMQGKLKGMGDAFKETSRHTSGFTDYMKAQKKEGREHKFVLGEVKDALGVVGLAMNLLGDSTGKGNEEFKKINDAANKSIVAFYGLDAIVSTLSKTFKFLGGGVGLAITAIGAIALAITDYINKSKGAAEATEVEITAHDRIVASLKAAKTAYENLASVKKQIAEKDKAEIENNLKLVDQWIASDTEKLKLVNDELKWADESQKSTKLRLFGEQTYLSNLIEINKSKKKFFQEDLSRINETLEFENKTQKAKEVKYKEWSFFRLNGELDLNTQLKLTKQDLRDWEKQLDIERLEEARLNTAFLRDMFVGIGDAMAQSLLTNEPVLKAALKSIGNAFLTLARTELITAQSLAIAMSWAKGDVGAIAKNLAILAGGLLLIEVARGQLNKMHSGGQAFVNAPANREVPIMVRGQETIRVTTPEQERRSGGGVVINFNSPVSDVQFVRNSIKKVLQETGLAVDKAFVNNRNKLSFAS